MLVIMIMLKYKKIFVLRYISIVVVQFLINLNRSRVRDSYLLLIFASIDNKNNTYVEKIY